MEQPERVRTGSGFIAALDQCLSIQSIFDALTIKVKA
jgi:hypothetical protein